MTSSSSSTAQLSGIRIVEIGHNETVHIAGMLLADQGAEVIRIDANTPKTFDTAYHRITDRAKRSVVFSTESKHEIQYIQQLLDRADVLIDDVGEQLNTKYGLSTGHQTRLIHCAIIPRENHDPNAPWNEETVSAQCGLYEDGLSVGAPPSYYDLPIATTLGALYTVTAVARALVGRERFGYGDTIRIPLDRICLFVQSLTIMIRSGLPTCWEPFRWVASPFQCTWRTGCKGFIYFHIAMPQHLRSFLFFLDKIGYTEQKSAIRELLAPGTRRDPTMPVTVKEAKGITKILQTLFLKKSADEWEELLGESGFCCTKVRDFNEWKKHPQVVESRQIVPLSNKGQSDISVPGVLFRQENRNSGSVAPVSYTQCTPEDCSMLWPQRPITNRTPDFKPPLSGIRVLDLGRVIAGPYAARLLAEAGAEVLQVSLRSNHLKWEEPFGVMYNQGKKSVAINFTRPEGKVAFRQLLDHFNPDIVVHNFLEEGAKKIGCDYETLRKRNNNIIVVDFKGYSAGGSWADRPGFEQNIQATSGVIKTFCGSTAIRMLPVPMNDITAGLSGSFAALLSLFNRERRGGNHITSFIDAPSILMHLPFLTEEAARERCERVSGYYRASDTWFYLSFKRDDIPILRKIPQLTESFTTDTESVFKSLLKKAFRKKPFTWLRSAFKSVDPGNAIILLPRTSLSTALKTDLADSNPLFSYRFHEGYGVTVSSNPPLLARHGQLQQLTTAPYVGRDNEEILKNAGIDPLKHPAPIPEVRESRTFPLKQFQRFLWYLKQAKWLLVIAYRNKELKKR